MNDGSNDVVMDAATYDHWYETPRGRWIGESEVALLLGELQPRPGESLLDVGCGTGFFTRAVASAVGGPVKGVDLNADWVDYARRRSAANISYDVADARALPFESASFDLVVSITALCFVEDEQAVIREMIRVAQRRVAIGLLNRRSLLWFQKGRHGGSGSYLGARWHTVKEAKRLFDDHAVHNVRVRTAIPLPGGGPVARLLQRLWPPRFHFGGFILVVADIDPEAGCRPLKSERGQE